MDRRTVLAIALVLLVVLITPRIFQPPRQPATTATPPSPTLPTAQPSQDQPQLPVPVSATPPPSERPTAEAERVDTIEVKGPSSEFRFVSSGGTLARVTLPTHRSLRDQSGVVHLDDPTGPLLSFRLLVGRDTVDLNTVNFTSDSADPGSVSFSAIARGIPVQLRHDVKTDSFIVRVTGTIGADSSGARPDFVLIDLPNTLTSYEADTLADQGSLSYAFKPVGRGAEGIAFRSLDPGERRIVAGPISWAVAKSKYFMLGVLMHEGDDATAEAQATGGPRTSSVPTLASASLIRRLGANGDFGFEVYVGPQSYQRLRAMGREFENSNPYGGFMQGVVQPFATIVMKVLLWMKSALPLSYGWLLIVFGVVVRLLLWPLNQGAMRTSFKMQKIQPELAALQTKYKGDPQKLQSEMMRVYKEHDMSPFSAFAGCLPLLLPMPILFALFFVFQNTIEFRGVPFLWLTDISLKDPFYIVPVLMGLSMFVMSWVGMRNAPPNPQAKIMLYVFPVMMTVMFANFASGLNLYYAVQNVAAIPQQWLIAHERAKTSNKKG
ncbi:MAG: membrane protein insertase YidC [Gemmatimonadota bacterium]